MIRSLFRHLIDSFKDLKRNIWMTLAAVTSVTITLTLLAAFMAFIANVNQFSKDVKQNVTVSVFVATETTKDEEKALKQQLQQLPNVDKVKYSSKENEYRKLKKANKDLWDGLFTEEDNPLYSVFMLSAKDPSNIKQIQNKAKSLPHVVYVTYGGEEAEKIIKLADKVNFWAVTAGLVLLIISILLVSNTIKLTIIARKDDIQIMRLVGATKAYIRWPFIFEGAWIGLLGSIIPLVLVNSVYKVIYQQMQPKLMQAHYTMISANTMFDNLLFIILVVGVIIGAFGSMISIRRFLKK